MEPHFAAVGTGPIGLRCYGIKGDEVLTMNVNQIPSKPSPDAGDVGQRTPPPSPGASASPHVPRRRWLLVVGLGLLYHVLRRRWLSMVGLGSLFGVIAAIAIWFLIPPRYTAESHEVYPVLWTV